MLIELKDDLKSLSNQQKAELLQRFFKTGVGEYAEGDKFLGITVPELRKLSKKYTSLSFQDLEKLLSSQIHEERFLSLAILRENYLKTKDEKLKQKIIDFSFKNLPQINNWDLVDTYIPYVFGEYFFSRSREVLYKFTISNNLWERRISILTTFYFLRKGDFEDTLKICEILLQDKHDLIHKACGWMLREIGKKDLQTLYNFLDKYYKIMPRTMLRYAIERLSYDKRKEYMKK
ncbi:MAG: DNA alkylation repair protein [Candidatus Gracilibacteria bacterium]|nr:DNA alkylation repair protein [Candidatus Gracilibacteria bacterium]